MATKTFKITPKAVRNFMEDTLADNAILRDNVTDADITNVHDQFLKLGLPHAVVDKATEWVRRDAEEYKSHGADQGLESLMADLFGEGEQSDAARYGEPRV